ncbi:hypothetical protein U1Q18_023075 [Sarracenia purpurea var. burkii]
MCPSFKEAPNITSPSFSTTNPVDTSPTTMLRIGFTISPTAEVAMRRVGTGETSQERSSCWDLTEGGDSAELQGGGDTDSERDVADNGKFERAGAKLLEVKGLMVFGGFAAIFFSVD